MKFYIDFKYDGLCHFDLEISNNNRIHSNIHKPKDSELFWGSVHVLTRSSGRPLKVGSREKTPLKKNIFGTKNIWYGSKKVKVSDPTKTIVDI